MPQPQQARCRPRDGRRKTRGETPSPARPFRFDFPRLVGGYLFMPRAPQPDSLDDIEGPEGGETGRDR